MSIVASLMIFAATAFAQTAEAPAATPAKQATPSCCAKSQSGKVTCAKTAAMAAKTTEATTQHANAPEATAHADGPAMKGNSENCKNKSAACCASKEGAPAECSSKKTKKRDKKRK